MPKIKPVAKSFKATLERGGRRMNLAIVPIPFDVAKTWGTRGELPVKDEINESPIRASLLPRGNGAPAQSSRLRRLEADVALAAAGTLVEHLLLSEPGGVCQAGGEGGSGRVRACGEKK